MFFTTATEGSESPESGTHSGYAPNYYPGTPNIAEAQVLRLSLGETIGGAQITLMPTRMASVSGIASDSLGQAVRAGVVVALQSRSDVALPTLSADALKDAGAAAAIGRSIALRAELAHAKRDDRTARQWASALSALWKNADPELQPTVAGLNMLVR